MFFSLFSIPVFDKLVMANINTLYVQGPFTVKAGSTTSLTFRNVFTQATTFQFYVDNPLFHISKPSESIRAHKEHKIAVTFDGSSDSASKAPVAGRLVVSCARSAAAATARPAPPNIQWIYYLKGVTHDGKDAKWLSVVNVVVKQYLRSCWNSHLLLWYHCTLFVISRGNAVFILCESGSFNWTF